MNIHQVQYVLAVAEYRHFESAAEKCHISQSTLSTMIAKFEEEVGVRIFNRKKKPVELTLEGSRIVDQLKVVSKDIEQLFEIAREMKGEVAGDINLSVIPTVAPFLLPLFLQELAQQFPKLNIVVREETTEVIRKKLKSREIDIGIVSIPLHDKELVEFKLYDEPFLFFDAKNISARKVSLKDLRTKDLCLMEEGHCMRTQVLGLCKPGPIKQQASLNFEYKAGSIDGLIRFVRSNRFSTLLPFLSTLDFSADQKRHLSPFATNVPFRTIGLIVHQHFVKKKLLNIIRESIIARTSGILPKLDTKAQMLDPL
jgi:LysR family hydrogen peroxide-inducible transcriptional activator